MALCIGVTTTEIHFVDDDNKLRTALVTTVAFENGMVEQQYGEGEEFVQIREPHNGVDMVGVCKDCGCAVWRDQEWEYSTNGNEGKGWMSHTLEEDCKK